MSPRERLRLEYAARVYRDLTEFYLSGYWLDYWDYYGVPSGGPLWMENGETH